MCIIDSTYTNLVRFSYLKAMQLTLPNTMKKENFLEFLEFLSNRILDKNMFKS